MIRKAQSSDLKALEILHAEAAKTPDGIARTPQEIDVNIIGEYFHKSQKQGLMFVAENPDQPQQLIAAIHCYKFDPECFKHTLANLILVVHPQFHGQGWGKKIFTALLEEVKNNHQAIARVELFVRVNNSKAIALYKKLGFVVEGQLKNRVLDSQGRLESDSMMAWENPNFRF